MTQTDTLSTPFPGRAGHGYLPGFDGLRAIAVMLVVVAHYGWGHIVPGGFGVTLFFFISGFLICRLLLAEQIKHDGIDLVAFYKRRFLRLSPPLLMFLAGSGAVYAFLEVQPSGLHLAAALTYTMNFVKMHTINDPSNVWGHLWSLAVEEHYYLIFPFLLIFLLCKRLSLPTVFGWICVAALINRLLGVYVFGREPATLYYSTDTRIDSILMGAWLASLLHDRGFEGVRKFVGWPAVVAGGALLLFSLLFRDEIFRQTWRYSVQNIGISLLMINLYAYGALRWGLAILETPPMKWVGKRSYEMYLWHFCVMAGVQAVMGISMLSTAISLMLLFPVSGLAYSLGTRPFMIWRSRLRPGGAIRPKEGPSVANDDQPAPVPATANENASTRATTPKVDKAKI